jgi:hypothetical protein
VDSIGWQLRGIHLLDQFTHPLFHVFFTGRRKPAVIKEKPGCRCAHFKRVLNYRLVRAQTAVDPIICAHTDLFGVGIALRWWTAMLLVG